MASPNTDVLFSNTGAQTGRVSEESRNTASGSPSIEAEMLVKALRNIINTPARSANGEYKHDMNQNTLGPDGEQFVIALKKFMSLFLHQRGPEGGIKVELEEEADDIPNSESHATSNDNPGPKDVADATPRTEPRPDSPAPAQNKSQEDLGSMQVHTKELPDRSVVSIRGPLSISVRDVFEQRKSQIIEKALNALREHVFNRMPIRLLCFKQSASRLQITLVERGEIYTQIASNLIREITGYKIGYGSKEEEELIKKYCQYAILSHTWLRGESREVTYGDWIRGEFDTQQPGYRKLVNFCRTAWIDHGIAFGWIDTICINKESSSELDESIRSMYKWYLNARVCITYLADTMALSDMSNDSWFTRGWTLQELLAPSDIKFYNAHWNKLVESDENDKEDPVIRKQIKEATTITAGELIRPLSWTPISRRMQMAAKRQVTREEDSAYSLMGIFNVSMATAYGEGIRRAFSRLLQEVLNSSLSYGITDVFNWAGSDALNSSPVFSLLPSSLQDYLHRSSDVDVDFGAQPIEPIMLTHLGLRITILLMPAIAIKSLTELQYAPFGDYHAITDIVVNSQYLESYYQARKIVSGSYSVLDARISGSEGWNKEQNWFQITLGVMNVGDADNENIMVPTSCLAVALRFDLGLPGAQKIPTKAPITFTLDKKSGPDEVMNHYLIERGELESHGMKLVTIVL